MDKLFQGLFAGELAPVISVKHFLLCISVSLALGLLMAVVCAWKNRHSKSFVITIGLLPAVVCVVIMMVNGNIGAGVAVAGAFSLVRFRSAPGSAKEIDPRGLTQRADCRKKINLLDSKYHQSLRASGMSCQRASWDEVHSSFSCRMGRVPTPSTYPPGCGGWAGIPETACCVCSRAPSAVL